MMNAGQIVVDVNTLKEKGQMTHSRSYFLKKHPGCWINDHMMLKLRHQYRSEKYKPIMKKFICDQKLGRKLAEISTPFYVCMTEKGVREAVHQHQQGFAWNRASKYFAVKASAGDP